MSAKYPLVCFNDDEQVLKHFFGISFDGVMRCDPAGCIMLANRVLEHISGYTGGELIGKSTMELIPPGEQYQKRERALLTQLWKDGLVIGFEHTWQRKDGSFVDVEINAALLKNGGGRVYGIIGAVRDVNRLKRTEETLKKSEEKYQTLIESATDAIVSANQEGIIVGFNRKAEEIFGYTREEILGKSVLLLSPEEDRERERRALERFKISRQLGVVGKTVEREGVRKDGQRIPLEATWSVIEIEGDCIITAILRDITERKRVEQKLRETKEFLESVIENSKDGIIITDVKGHIISVNTAMEEMSGFRKEELVGKHASIFSTEDKEMRRVILEKTAEMFEKGFSSYEAVQKTKNGTSINVECLSSMIKNEQGEYIAGVSIIRNITERKKIEQQLFQTEKLKSLGALAGGVAHDFNNILAAILGRVQLLRMYLERPQGLHERGNYILELRKGLTVIENAALSGAETVKRVQEFSRREVDDIHFTKLDINTVVSDALEFTRMRWKDEADSKGIKVVVKKELSPVPLISGSRAELHEVFINLIHNALDAMPQGGLLAIKTFRKDGFVWVEVKDTGCGIPQAIQGRIFDPFFTTKGVKSSGLGLSASYGIIERHHGIISVDSSEGQGTAVTIKLPVKGDAGCEDLKPTHVEGAKESTSEFRERVKILVIEDEEGVREVLKDILTEGGHEVVVAYDGMQGIELFESEDFDLVFTDLGMPVMSGWQVAEKIKGINPKTPVALVTGWSVAMSEPEMKHKGIDFIIKKPFAVEQVLRRVQEGIVLRNQYKVGCGE